MAEQWEPANIRATNLQRYIGSDLVVRILFPGQPGVVWFLLHGNMTLTSGSLTVETLEEAKIPALQAVTNWFAQQVAETSRVWEEEVLGLIRKSRSVPQPDSKNAGPEAEETGLEG
jgi:hypothetical protein